MDDPITLLRERSADAFERFYSISRQLQEKYHTADYPKEKDAAVRAIYYAIGHDIRALGYTFDLSLNNAKSWQNFLSDCPGSLKVRYDHLAQLPTNYPELITPRDIKPLLDRLVVIRRLGEYGLRRMGMDVPALGAHAAAR